jgi:hypothetical protein
MPQTLTFGLVDDSFTHYPYSSVLGQVPQFFEWDRKNPLEHSQVVFTNENILNPLYKAVPLENRIAWLQESRGVLGFLYKQVKSVIKDYTLFLTHDTHFLRDFENTRFLPGGGVYVGNPFGGGETRIYSKSLMCSLVCSYKNTTPLHSIRNSIADTIKEMKSFEYQVFGNSPYLFNYIPVIESLEKFRFSIVVENTLDDYYFTEKILNCFATGTVPIYLGARKISEFFDVEGIIKITSVRTLQSKILPSLSEDLYNSMLPNIKRNFELVQQFKCTEDYVWTNYLSSQSKRHSI